MTQNVKFFSSVICVGTLVGLVQAAAQVGSQTNAVLKPHVVPAETVDAVDYFRTLLQSRPEKRQEMLAARSPQAQKVLLAKVHEYEALPEKERDLKLSLLQLRLYLVPILKSAPSERAAAVANVPPLLTPFVIERLTQWDRVPVAIQQELLKHDSTIDYFLRFEGRASDKRQGALAALPPTERTRVSAAMVKWESIAPSQRERISADFHQFLELNDKSREKALNELSEAERRTMEATLDTFAHLPPDQRAHAIESFSRLARMDPVERSEFLRKAERWESMSLSERQTWRDVVQALPSMPPLPPDFADLPPLPTGAGR